MEVTINGVKTNYKVFGEGKPFLILHGWGSNSERWLAVAEAISKGSLGAGPFKVIVPDLPGFGESDTLSAPWNTNKYINWIEGFVAELKLGDFYLLGHSFGGALACKLSINHPQQVTKLFLVSAAFVRKRTVKKQVLGRASKIAKFFSFLPFYPLAKKAFYKYIVGSYDYSEAEDVMKKTFMNVVADDLSQFVAFIKVPTVIIWGDKDEATLVEDAYFLNKKIKHSKLVVLNGAGHNLHTKNTEVLAQKVLENI